LVTLLNPQEIRDIARALALREQDVATREGEIARREQDLSVKRRELTEAKADLKQLELRFQQATGGAPTRASEAIGTPPRVGPSLARANATVAARILALLEMEPRALSPAEVHSLLELPPPPDTVRTTLWKMADAGIVVRLARGTYCSHRHAVDVLRTGEGAG
jgi:hypothetical protein